MAEGLEKRLDELEKRTTAVEQLNARLIGKLLRSADVQDGDIKSVLDDLDSEYALGDNDPASKRAAALQLSRVYDAYKGRASDD